MLVSVVLHLFNLLNVKHSDFWADFFLTDRLPLMLLSLDLSQAGEPPTGECLRRPPDAAQRVAVRDMASAGGSVAAGARRGAFRHGAVRAAVSVADAWGVNTRGASGDPARGGGERSGELDEVERSGVVTQLRKPAPKL